jgi:hypothetical protein
MPLSEEQLLAIARNYWRSDKEYDSRLENSPEYERLQALWERELKSPARWRGLLSDVRRELPDFTIGDATATLNSCFRCVAYSDKGATPRFAVVGCVSILVPLYTVHGVQYEVMEGKRQNARACFEPLPPEMRFPADVIAKRIEARFGVDAFPRELAEAPIPLIVHWKEPPRTTLFDALFASQPERIP